MDATVAAGLGSAAGALAVAILNEVSGGCPDGFRSRATYCPAARLTWATLVPRPASTEKTMLPMP